MNVMSKFSPRMKIKNGRKQNKIEWGSAKSEPLGLQTEDSMSTDILRTYIKSGQNRQFGSSAISGSPICTYRPNTRTYSTDRLPETTCSVAVTP